MISFRPAQASDYPFILGSWLSSYAAADTGVKVSEKYRREALAEGRCVVAFATAEPDVLIGWALARGLQLEYAYVKKSARNCGICRDLIRELGNVRGLVFSTAAWQRYEEL